MYITHSVQWKVCFLPAVPAYYWIVGAWIEASGKKKKKKMMIGNDISTSHKNNFYLERATHTYKTENLDNCYISNYNNYMDVEAWAVKETNAKKIAAFQMKC